MEIILLKIGVVVFLVLVLLGVGFMLGAWFSGNMNKGLVGKEEAEDAK